ncbi:eukaryotic translation initiation factor 3 subunit A [Spiromyces aspiralis]|uniref:Eukaryotic translation initiation factor 3 subunit A n=1 Tax=Spiromyces aspiralis TaxID=68401 RepID=A0ACC1I1T2_9FUNG|nr:eukaryotic translation initiation factor 3 subunit A [Spiromyces aspiralis]
MYRGFAHRTVNPLKRAEELIAVGQNAAALDKIKEGLANRHVLKDDSKKLNDLFMKFAELCVEQRKGKAMKDGLQNIRRSMSENNVQVIERGVRRILELCEQKVEEAQANAEKINLENIVDLEATETPESIVLSVVSGEQSKDRTDREVVTPWLKFLWEAYRNLLDFLRQSSLLEQLYQGITRNAIDFCYKYQRKTEIRRLCELLRTHMQYVVKSQGQSAFYLNINNPDVLQRFLESRFHQLDTVVKMELWQEAFRSIEDIHYLIQHSKRPIKAKSMANYYEKLTRIMFMAKNQLFLAAAWHRYYALVRNRTSEFTAEELQNVANNVLLATLAVPIIKPSARVMSTEAEENKRRTNNLTNLLFLTHPPTRDSLIADLAGEGILNHARSELRPIYHYLEEKFHPLTICKRLAPILESEVMSRENEGRYAPLLCNVILTRLVQQLSQVYTTVKLDYVFGLAKFPSSCNMSPVQIERFIMNGARRGEFRLRIDYGSRSVHFDTALFEQSSSSSSGAQLQALPSELVRTQLTSLSACLSNAQAVVCPEVATEQSRRRDDAIADALARIREEHKYVLARKVVIERKNELLETMLARKEKEEARERAIRLQREKELERKRLEEEREQRMQERLRKEREAIQREEAKRLAESIKKQAGIDVSSEDLENLDTTRLMEMQMEELEKERQRANARLKAVARKIDHTERAYRKEEIPLLEQDYLRQKEQDRASHEAEQKERLRIHRENYEQSMYHKKRMQRMLPDFEAAKQAIEERNAERLSKLRAEMREKLAEAKRAHIEEFHRLKAEEEVRRRREMEEEEERRRAEELAEAKRRQEEEEAEKRRLAEAKSSKYVRPGIRNANAGADVAIPATAAPAGADTGDWRRPSGQQPSSSADLGSRSPSQADSDATATKPGVWRPRRFR